MEIEKKSTYPDHPINFIVPFGPGGGADMQARMLERFISQRLHQPVVVINKAGGAGALGWDEIQHSEHDGYTIGIAGTEVLLHTLYRPNQTHYFTTLDPLAQVSTSSRVLVVNAEKPWKNVNEFIQDAKQSPKDFKYGNSGVGSFANIISEVFSRAVGIKVKQVPFQSGGESVAALLGNHVQFAFLSPSIVKEHLRAGTLKALAVTGEKRMVNPVFADVPTFKELGIDVVFTNWFCVVAQKDLPEEVKRTLEKVLKEAIADPEFQEFMARSGMEVEYLGNEECRLKWVKEIRELKKMLEDTGILEQVRAQQK